MTRVLCTIWILRLQLSYKGTRRSHELETHEETSALLEFRSLVPSMSTRGGTQRDVMWEKRAPGSVALVPKKRTEVKP
jgi:hypothetical protein